MENNLQLAYSNLIHDKRNIKIKSHDIYSKTSKTMNMKA